MKKTAKKVDNESDFSKIAKELKGKWFTVVPVSPHSQSGKDRAENLSKLLNYMMDNDIKLKKRFVKEFNCEMKKCIETVKFFRVWG